MTITREQATREACAIIGLAYHSIGDYTKASDGFCDLCPAQRHGNLWSFSNEGHVFDYVRLAVVEKLKRDGHKIAQGFDESTGVDLTLSPRG